MPLSEAEGKALTRQLMEVVTCRGWSYEELQGLAHADVATLNAKLRTLGFTKVAERTHLRFALLLGRRGKTKSAEEVEAEIKEAEEHSKTMEWLISPRCVARPTNPSTLCAGHREIS